MNLPASDFISAPVWLVTVLHILTLTMHFVAMNILLGGVLIVVSGKLRGDGEGTVLSRLIQIFPSIMAATVTLGVAPLLFLQLIYPRQVYGSAIVMAWFWLMVIPVVIIGYYFLYGAAFAKRYDAGRRRNLLIVTLVALLYVSLVFSSVFSMAEQPDLVKQLYGRSQSGFAWNPSVGDYFFRWLHMILGAATVGGFFVGLLGREEADAYLIGRTFFLWGMASASMAGLIYLFTLGETIAPFMRTPGIWALTAGIVLSAGSLHFFFKKKFLPAGLMLFVSLFTMVLSRHYVRLLRLREHFDPASWRIEQQWSPLLIFIACFALALGTIFYMLRLFFGSRKE